MPKAWYDKTKAQFKNATSKLGDYFKGDVNKIRNSGMTALQEEVVHCHQNKVERLLDKGAGIDDKGSNGKPPLLLAAERNYYKIAALLLEKGADVNAEADLTHQTALWRAVQKGHYEMVDLLLRKGATTAIKNSQGKTILFYVPHNRPRILELLLNAEVPINQRDHKGQTVFHEVASDLESYYAGMHRTLLMNGADPNLANHAGVTPFMMALTLAAGSRGVYEQLYPFINDGAMLHTKTAEGIDIFNLALHYNDLTTLVILQRRGYFNDQKAARFMPTIEMIAKAEEPYIKMLTIFGELSRLEDEFKKELAQLVLSSHLKEQARSGKWDEKTLLRNVQLFLKMGADLSYVEPERGKSLLHFAVEHKHEKLADYMMKAGAPLNICDKEGMAPLHYAVRKRDLSLVDLLLDHGADPNLVDARGWTILDHLARHDDRSSPVVQRLIVAGGVYQKQLPIHQNDGIKHKTKAPTPILKKF